MQSSSQLPNNLLGQLITRRSDQPFAKTAYIALGSNLGNRLKNILFVLNQFNSQANQTCLHAVSSIFKSEPSNLQDKKANDFYNLVCSVKTTLSPKELLKFCQGIEEKLGRTQSGSQKKYSRTIDIDLIMYESLIVTTPELTLPHPCFKERDFVFIPLAEILDEFWKDPVLGLSCQQLFSQGYPQIQTNLSKDENFSNLVKGLVGNSVSLEV
ncbi:MAG TPA: 2-amino-4-hydroxy-6-hydroxymethyldihydropteridine diphosphokinase [Vampirovibrionales bacterium]